MAGRAHSRFVTIGDQLVSSLSNFALVAFVANVSSPADFGRFSLGYVVLIFFLGFQRALVGEVLLVRFSGGGEQRSTEGDDAAAGVSAALGAVSALALAVCGVVSGGDAAVWIALAVAGPIVFVQDIARYILIARGRSGHALASDTVWAALSLPLMFWLVVSGAPAWTVVATWVATGAVAAIIAVIAARLRPKPVRGATWLSRNRDIAVRFSGEYASLNASNTVVWFLLAAPLGVAGVAALRGASLLFSPLNTAFNAVRIAVVPELVRAADPGRYRSRMRETAIVLTALAVIWSVAVLVLPAEWGRLLLGETWDSAAPLRVAYALQSLAMVVYTVLLAHFRARALHRQSTLMRSTLAVATLVAPLLLGLALAAQGAAWGFALAVAASAVVGAAALRRAGRDGDRPRRAD
ncbi:hypothetical protein ACFQRL_15170 [Microbacterium fluvii]|uniref:O-antigen/teichoic acid export membrane protein n=1 Tax=Microbacterium fluvii TaxID=415215 RepID=A0ABW2HKC6_9MICO|nr:hypothetical protein [Microbacterium fluvii]MCU4673935.1 hypothetical protein [Microbacterium fluvii]